MSPLLVSLGLFLVLLPPLMLLFFALRAASDDYEPVECFPPEDGQ